MQPRSGAGLKITWIGLCVNLALGVVKAVAGALLGSKALMADGMHSLLDLLTDFAVLLGLMMAQRPEDANHHYGHHKYTSLSKLFIGGVLVVFAIALVSSAVMDFRAGPTVPQAGWAAVFAFVSLVVKEVLFWATRRVARRLKSDLILANAWHHRADSLSSFGVALALVGMWLGGETWAFLDDAVTMMLGGYLAFEALKIFFRACAELLDAAPAPPVIEDLREHILPTPGALAYHDFRVRRVGDVYEVDLHLQVDPNLTVDRGHAIAAEVKQRILEKHPEVCRVLVHVEPANKEHIVNRGIFDIGPMDGA